MIKKENSKLLSRLYNYKFEQAARCLEGEDEYVKQLVLALAAMFGNCGWFSGTMATIIDYAINTIKPDENEEE